MSARLAAANLDGFLCFSRSRSRAPVVGHPFGDDVMSSLPGLRELDDALLRPVGEVRVSLPRNSAALAPTWSPPAAPPESKAGSRPPRMGQVRECREDVPSTRQGNDARVPCRARSPAALDFPLLQLRARRDFDGALSAQEIDGLPDAPWPWAKRIAGLRPADFDERSFRSKPIYLFPAFPISPLSYF